MKFFALIMACIVLALSCMPCADAIATSSKAKHEIKSSHNRAHEEDICSPFCHCTCCAGFSINHFIAALNIIPSYKNNIATGFLSSEVIEIAIPVWQPPQLV